MEDSVLLGWQKAVRVVISQNTERVNWKAAFLYGSLFVSSRFFLG